MKHPASIAIVMTLWATLRAVPPLSAQEPAASAPLRPVTATVVVGGQARTVTLVDRTRDSVVFVLGETAVGARRTVAVTQVESIRFDLAAIQSGDLHRAIRVQDWSLAVGLLSPVISPLLPYFDLPNDNAVEYALSMGDYMMRSAARRAAGGTEPDHTAAGEQYRMAYTVLRHISRSASAAGQIAGLKSLQCLLALDRASTAQRLFDETAEPMPGDRAYGRYWLVKAELDLQREDFRSAIEAAVKSLCFDDKNMETFPDALMLSARCYEELLEWYRARDVYYEIASIFPKTDWSRTARERLQLIMDQELTLDDEGSAVEDVFFGLKEDMNARVRDLLAGAEQDQRITPAAAAADSEAEGAADWDLRVFE